jgi:hypothetical protein
MQQRNLTPLPVKKFVERNPGFTEGGVRWDIFNSAKNGLDAAGAIRRKGTRVYVIEERYIAWIDSNPSTNAAQAAK